MAWRKLISHSTSESTVTVKTTVIMSTYFRLQFLMRGEAILGTLSACGGQRSQGIRGTNNKMNASNSLPGF